MKGTRLSSASRDFLPRCAAGPTETPMRFLLGEQGAAAGAPAICLAAIERWDSEARREFPSPARRRYSLPVELVDTHCHLSLPPLAARLEPCWREPARAA